VAVAHAVARATALAPNGLEPGSPFGQSIAALVVDLHYAHAIGLERLATLIGEMFALTISEGAISNMLLRAREPLLVAATTIHETVTASPAVGFDETSARVTGKIWWDGSLSAPWRCCMSFTPAAARLWFRRCSGPCTANGLGLRYAGQSGRRWGGMQVCLHICSAMRATPRPSPGQVVQCGDVAFKRLLLLLLRAIAIGRATRYAERYHAEAISRRSRPPVRSHHGGCPNRRAGTQTAQAYRRQPRRALHR
jgi:hypothetical protein